MVSEMKAHSSRSAQSREDDQPDRAEEVSEVVVKAASLERGPDGRIAMAIGSEAETIRVKDDRPPTAKKTRKKAPQSPHRGMGTMASYSSETNSKYLGKVYTDGQTSSSRGTREDVEVTNLTRELQHDFNMKLAETIQREQDFRAQGSPVYAQVKIGKAVRKEKEQFIDEDIDAAIDAAFEATFESEEGYLTPVMGTEAIKDRKKREHRHKKGTGGRKKEEREKREGRKTKERSGESKERRQNQESEARIEAVHEVKVNAS